MKKTILLLMIIVANATALPAQNGQKRGEKIQALKIAFITQKLDLSSHEAQLFWPVYGDYEKELRSVFSENQNEDVIENDERILNIRKKYRPEFTKIVGQARMNKFFSAEKEFRTVLLQQLKKQNNQQR